MIDFKMWYCFALDAREREREKPKKERWYDESNAYMKEDNEFGYTYQMI